MRVNVLKWQDLVPDPITLRLSVSFRFAQMPSEGIVIFLRGFHTFDWRVFILLFFFSFSLLRLPLFPPFGTLLSMAVLFACSLHDYSIAPLWLLCKSDFENNSQCGQCVFLFLSILHIFFECHFRSVDWIQIEFPVRLDLTKTFSLHICSCIFGELWSLAFINENLVNARGKSENELYLFPQAPASDDNQK